MVHSIILWYVIQIQEDKKYKRALRGLNLGQVLVPVFLIQPPGPSGVGEEEIRVRKGTGGSPGRDRNFKEASIHSRTHLRGGGLSKMPWVLSALQTVPSHYVGAVCFPQSGTSLTWRL